MVNQWEVNFWKFVWMARQQEKHIWKSLAACRFPKILSWQSDQNIRTAKFGDAPKWGCPILKSFNFEMFRVTIAIKKLDHEHAEYKYSNILPSVLELHSQTSPTYICLMH